MSQPVSDEPKVILNLLRSRGVNLEGISGEKLALRLRICVRQQWLSEKQRKILEDYLQ